MVVDVGSNVLELNMHKEARGIKFYGGALRIKEFTRNCCDLQEEMHWIGEEKMINFGEKDGESIDQETC